VDVRSFFSQSRVFVVTGKGGVGKTTLSGVMANLAGSVGLAAVVVQVGAPGDGRSPETAYLSRLFGSKDVPDYDGIVLRRSAAATGDRMATGPGDVVARSLRPDTALVEYLHLHGMRRLSRKLVSSGALDIVATAVPGMPDMLVLGKIKQLERAMADGQPGAPDVVVLDAPAAGHAVKFLQSPYGLLEAASGGPVRAQARDVVEMLADPRRCQVVLVTTPEETPVSETIETAQLLEDKTGAKLCAVVVNARLPVLAVPAGARTAEGLAGLASAAGTRLPTSLAADLEEAARLRSSIQDAQAEQVARLASELPLPQLQLPFCFSDDLGPEHLAALTAALKSAVDEWVPVQA
jgi:anion-transporting  ArsA/GET3 family ATPase